MYISLFILNFAVSICRCVNVLSYCFYFSLFILFCHSVHDLRAPAFTSRITLALSHEYIRRDIEWIFTRFPTQSTMLMLQCSGHAFCRLFLSLVDWYDAMLLRTQFSNKLFLDWPTRREALFMEKSAIKAYLSSIFFICVEECNASSAAEKWWNM